MFYDQRPPIETSKNEFPELSSVVTVSSCWYYLSLLERFVDATKDMSEEVLKIYLVRAEYRYFQWILKSSKHRQVSTAVPPIDVAFFWQAHMLSPMRYYEDCQRSPHFFTYGSIPLQRLHEARTMSSDDSSIMRTWKKLMNEEPYDLAENIISDTESCAKVTCIVCLNRIESPWKEYTEWRTDHSIALQCHCCFAMFTVKHVGKANLLTDNIKTQITAGLLMDPSGYTSVVNNREQELLLPLKETKALPFNRGLKPLEEHILAKQEKTTYDDYSNRYHRSKKLLNAIQSTYLCTPYRESSIDLIQAVARQYKFAFKVTKNINWNSPQGMINGIRKYGNFLAVIGDNPGLTAVPTIEIDLAWHTHMLHHQNYRSFCLNKVGWLINHDDTIPEALLESYVKKTDLAWKARDLRRKEAEAEIKARLSSQTSFQVKEPPSVITNDTLVERKVTIKSKVKSLFSRKSKKKESLSLWPSYPPVSKVPSNGYLDAEIMFKGEYKGGKYKKSNSAAANEPNGKVEEPPANDTEEMVIDEEKKNNAGNNNEEDDDKSSTVYDKENVSFHDKREIKEFIKLNNNDKLMDHTFKEVKISSYGFIGTSTCANTDYLDQWPAVSSTGNQKEKIGEEVDLNISRYSKVFLTKGKPVIFSAKGILQLHLLEKTNKKKYAPYYEAQNNRYNTAGDTFNWYLVSMTWNDCTIDNRHNSSCGGGLNNCLDSNNPTASCAGISAACDSSKTSSCSSGGGGHSSSCGTSSSSCGGSSSSCGSSCGGGGGSSCGGS